PPVTGDYVFWIASDDQSELLLSTDEQPARARRICGVNSWTSFRQWFSEPDQQSAPVSLQAGRLYYIEARMKEGFGGDHLSVMWLDPSGLVEEPIPAARFLAFGAAIAPPTILFQPASASVNEGGTAVFRVVVENADPVNYQWLDR